MSGNEAWQRAVHDSEKFHQVYLSNGIIHTAGGERLLDERDNIRSYFEMDHADVVSKALELGCKFEHRGKHKALVTPAGDHIYISDTPSDWRSGRHLMKNLRDKGIDVKRGVQHGPVERVDQAKMYCKEKRCANLACARNWLTIDPLQGPSEKDIAWTSFRTNVCGYKPMKGGVCGKVYFTASREPQLCVLEPLHAPPCRPEKPAPTPAEKIAAEAARREPERKNFARNAAPPSPEERALPPANDVVRAGERPTKRSPGRPKNGDPATAHERKREAVELVLGGESIESVSRAYGFDDSSVGLWVRDPRYGGDPNYVSAAPHTVVPEGEKRRVVADVLENHLTISQAVEKYKHGRTEISNWIKDPALGGDPRLNLRARGQRLTAPANDHKRRCEAVAAMLGGKTRATVAREFGYLEKDLQLWALDPTYGGERRRFHRGPEYKRAAVARVFEGEHQTKVAASLGIAQGLLGNWCRDPRYGGDPHYNGRRPPKPNGHAKSHSTYVKEHPVTPKHIDLDERTRFIPDRERPLPPPGKLQVPPSPNTGLKQFVERPAAPDADERERELVEAARKQAAAEREAAAEAARQAAKPPKRELKFCIFCGTDVQGLQAVGIRFCPDCGHSFAGVL